MLFNVLSTVLKSHKLKSILNTYYRSRYDRTVYLKVLENLVTTYYGAVGQAIIMQELTTRTLVRTTDPTIMVDELRSLHMRFNSMLADGMTVEVSSSAISAARRNLLYRNCVQTQHGLDNMRPEGFEAKPRRFPTCLMKATTCSLQWTSHTCVTMFCE